MNFPESEMTVRMGRWFEAWGYQWWVEMPSCGSCIDMIGRRGNFLVAIEMKVCLSWKVIRQAALAQLDAHESYVAVLTKPKNTSLEKCRRVGVGVLRVGRDVQVLVSPRNKHTFEGHIKNMLRYTDEFECGGVAGLPCLLGGGPAQDVYRKVQAYREAHPKATWREVFDKIPNHYSHVASMQGAMRIVRERLVARDRRRSH
ncbi:MAG: hypothetical protein V3U60_16030 [Gammaproteobacteria bacterium]